MQFKKYRQFDWVFSPITYLVLIWVSYALSYIENGLGWGGFDYVAQDYIHYFFVFTVTFFIGKVVESGIPLNVANTEQRVNTKILWGFFFIAAFFHSAKFVNIGDIPLLGDPMSRYNLTLGGYEDYPSRLLAPIGILFYILFLKTSRKRYIYATFICTLLPLLLMQRQEVLILLLGCVMVYTHNFKISVTKAVVVGCFTCLLLFVGISVLTIARYGADNLATDMGVFEVSLWIIHGELTAPIRLGAFVDDITPNLNGVYSFGTFVSIFVPGFKTHGAEFIRAMYTDAETAQSVGSIFGFAIDFGVVGVGVIGFVVSVFSFYFYRRWKTSNSYFYATVYPVLFLQLLWNLRSGTFLLNPLIIYLILAVYFILNIHAGKKLSDAAKLLFLITLPVSLMGLIARI